MAAEDRAEIPEVDSKVVVAVPAVKVPDLVKGVPEEVMRRVEPVPALNVAEAVMFRTPSTVVVGVVPPKVAVKVVAPSPMVSPPKTRVPAVPAQEAPVEPIQFVPEAEPKIVVVPAEPWFRVSPEATLIEPELATPVEPTVKALEPMMRLPSKTERLLSAVTATPAVKVPVPLISRL